VHWQVSGFRQPGKGSNGASRDSQRRVRPEVAAGQAPGPVLTETACQRRFAAGGLRAPPFVVAIRRFLIWT